MHTVFHEVARFCAITWIFILSMTTDFDADRRAVRESFDRPTQAFAGDCDQRWRQFGHWNVRMRMARVTAVSPTGGWTSRRILVDSDSTALGTAGTFGVLVSEQAQHSQVSFRVVLADGGEAEFGQAECGARGMAG